MKLACLNKKKAIFAVIVIILGCLFVFKGRITLIAENKEVHFKKLITSAVKGVEVKTDSSFFFTSLKDEKIFTLTDASEAKVFITNHNHKEVYVNLAMKVYEGYEGEIKFNYQFNDGPSKNIDVADLKDCSSFENSDSWFTLWNLELKPGQNMLLFNLFLKEGEAYIYPPVDENLRLKVFAGGIKVLPIGSLPWKQDKLKNKPNVLFVLIDNVQPNHLGCYGYFRDTSPNLDALAKEGVIFKQMITNATWTRPAMSVMLTSKYSFPFLFHHDKTKIMSLDEILNKEGYQTFAVTANPNMIEEFNLGTAFQSYYKADYPFEGSSASELASQAIVWLRRNYKNKFYLYLHFMDAHFPYNCRKKEGCFMDSKLEQSLCEQFLEKRDYLPDIDALNAYDSGIYNIDQNLEKVIDVLKELKIYKNTLIIVISDHGHYAYTAYLMDNKLKISCLMSCPGILEMNKEVDAFLSAVDIMPAILDIIEIECPYDLDGVSFAGLIKKRNFLNKTQKVNHLNAEVYIYDNLKASFAFSPAVAVRTEQFLLTYYYEENRFEMYDLLNDPYQKNNIAFSDSGNFLYLKDKLMAWMERQYKIAEDKKEIGIDNLPDEKIKALRSLGYMQ